MDNLVPQNHGRYTELALARNLPPSFDMRKPSDSPTPPDLTLPQLLLILRRRLSLILKVATAILVLGILVCLLSPRKYSATSTVMVQSNSANGIDRSSLIGTGPTPPDSNEADLTVQTQAKLLQSNTLALRTIRKLDLVHKSDFLQSRGLSSIFSSISSRPPLPNSSATDVKLLQIFQKSLTVKPVVGTRLLNVTFSSSNPQLSADVANELVRELGDYVSETRYKATEAASQTLTKQLADLRIQSESLQAKVAAMQAQSGLYSIGTTDAQGRQQAYSAILDQFQRAALTLNEASQNRVLKQAIYDSAKNGNAEMISSLAGNSVGGTVGSGITNSLSTIQQLRTQEATLQGQLDQLKVKFGPAYPKLAELEGNIDSVKRAIKDETERISNRAKSDFLVADQTFAGAKSSYDQQKVQADALNNRTIKYMIARQEADESRSLYEDLLKRLKEVGILQGLKSDTIATVDQALPPLTPTTPNIPIYLAAALGLGMLGGCLSALFAELLDDKVRDAAAVEGLGLPFLGMLPPFNPRDQGLEVLRNPGSAYSDAIRNIRSSLLRPRVGDPAKVVLVTTAMPTKTKAMLSANLAASAAQAGKKVLLVEADMKDPEFRSIIGFSNGVGLNQVLLGEAFDGNVARYPNLSALYVLPSDDGQNKISSSALVDSDQMYHLIEEWRDNFDLVIIDAPCVLSLADARYLSEMADATIEVAECGTTTLTSLKRAHSLLSDHAKNLFFVLSGVSEASNAYKSYYGHNEKSLAIRGPRP